MSRHTAICCHLFTDSPSSPPDYPLNILWATATLLMERKTGEISYRDTAAVHCVARQIVMTPCTHHASSLTYTTIMQSSRFFYLVHNIIDQNIYFDSILCVLLSCWKMQRPGINRHPGTRVTGIETGTRVPVPSSNHVCKNGKFLMSERYLPGGVTLTRTSFCFSMLVS